MILAASLGTGRAQADAERSATLDYTVAEDLAACPDRQAFADAVAARLGYDPFARGGRINVRVRIRRAGSTLVASVELRADGGAVLGAKSLESSRCDDLVSATSFAVSLAIDPSRTLAPTPPAAPPAPVSPPPKPEPVAAASPPPPLPTREASVRPDAPSRVRVGADVFLGGGAAGWGPAAGNVAGMVVAGAGVEIGRLSLELEGRFVAPSSAAVTGGDVTTRTVGAALLPCARWTPVLLCAQAFLGALNATGEAADGESGVTVFAQVGLRVGAEIRLGALVIQPFVDPLLTLTPTTLRFRGTPVWSTSLGGVSAGIRLAHHFL